MDKLEENIEESPLTDDASYTGDPADALYYDAKVYQLPEYERATTSSQVHPAPIEIAPKKQEEVVPVAQSERETVFNTRELSKDALTYELETFEKNAMIIFNHANPNGYDLKPGTEEDIKNLKHVFSKFGFMEIEVKTDLIKTEIDSELEKWLDRDFTDYGCVAVVILTQGSDSEKLLAKDESYHEKDLIAKFQVSKNPTLITKPKILLIEASRATRNISEAQVFYDYTKESNHYTVPVESDVLVMRSSYTHPDSTSSASWFIKVLCRTIDEMSHEHDFEKILTKVKRLVRNKLGQRELSLNERTVVTTSTLMRKLYLRTYQGRLTEETEQGMIN